MIFNIGNSDPLFDLSVSGYPGATVTITDGKKTYEKVTDSEGNAVFEKLKRGTWNATAKDGSISIPYEVEIGRDSDNALNINAIPEFTYDGSYQVVDDNDNPITASLRDWKIRLLEVGTVDLNITKLNGAADGIDVFCVGGGGKGGDGSSNNEDGGGGGGGGGFTTTKLGVTVSVGEYTMSIGGSGGTTYAFKGTAIEVSAKNGGNGGSYGGNGGDGGSGGGAGTWSTNVPASGGTNGANGSAYATLGGTGGKGQGDPPGTREFHESKGTLYSSGGKGGTHGNYSTDRFTAANTGNGGNGGNGGTTWNVTDRSGVAGGSGIVIIRNKR